MRLTWAYRVCRLDKIVRLPLSFFSSQPTGRLLNRFARDTEAGKEPVCLKFSQYFKSFTLFLGCLQINCILYIQVPPECMELLKSHVVTCLVP